MQVAKRCAGKIQPSARGHEGRGTIVETRDHGPSMAICEDARSSSATKLDLIPFFYLCLGYALNIFFFIRSVCLFLKVGGIENEQGRVCMVAEAMML